MKDDKKYNDISDVRDEIDRIDHAILKLLSDRNEFVEEIVRFKTDQDSVIAHKRQLNVYRKRREWAVELGLDADLIERIYRQLVQYNIEHELKLLKNNPQ